MKIKKSRKKSRRYTRKKKNEANQSTVWNLIKLVFIIAASMFIIYHFFLRESTDLSNETVRSLQTTTEEQPPEELVDYASLSKKDAVEYALDQLFNEFGLLDSWIRKSNDVTTVRLPQDFPNIIFIQRVLSRMNGLDFDILTSTENLIRNQSKIDIGYEDELLKKLIINHDFNLKKVRGKIAIIIDDFGYSDGEDIDKLLQSSLPLTVAILPGLSRSNEMYERARNANKETIIHMPMEALEEKVDYTAYTLYSTMSDIEIQQRIDKVIKDYPVATGMNNHMGSKVTQDDRIMNILMTELKKHNYYFIDSKTTTESIAFQVAEKVGIPALENNIFLERDRNDDEEYLKKKLEALKKIAERVGTAIAIGHPYSNTVKVLLAELPKLRNQGFVLVPVSELVN